MQFSEQISLKIYLVRVIFSFLLLESAKSHAWRPCVLACLRACVLTHLRDWCACVFTSSRARVFCVLACLRAYVFEWN